MKYRLIEKELSFDSASTDYTESFDVGGIGGDSINCFAIIDVDTPSAKTFDSGVSSSLEVQDITYTAVTRGADGDNITITYTGGALAGAEVVSVVGTDISIQIESGVSTATQVKTAYDLSAPAVALATAAITGTAGDAQVTAAEAPFTGGVDSEVVVADDELIIPSHGLNLGLKGQLTTTGTLPTGLSLATDYFVIVVDADTIKLATSLANAEAGTAVNITDQGTSGAVNTFTATALAGGGIKFQQSNDDTNWVDLGSATSITADGNIVISQDRPTARYIRVGITLTAGNISATLQVLVKGDRDV